MSARTPTLRWSIFSRFSETPLTVKFVMFLLNFNSRTQCTLVRYFYTLVTSFWTESFHIWKNRFIYQVESSNPVWWRGLSWSHKKVRELLDSDAKILLQVVHKIIKWTNLFYSVQRKPAISQYWDFEFKKNSQDSFLFVYGLKKVIILS